MNKKLITRVFICIIISSFTTLAGFSGSYYYDDGSLPVNSNADKFVPQSGVKIKESKMADWMENTTQKAMNGEKTPKTKNNTSNQKHNRNTNTYQKSYKWF